MTILGIDLDCITVTNYLKIKSLILHVDPTDNSLKKGLSNVPFQRVLLALLPINFQQMMK